MNYIAIPGLKFRQTRSLPVGLRFMGSDRIINIVTTYFHTNFEEIKKFNRKRTICYPRQVCMWALSKKSSMTLADIGKLFGRDHSTIIHACNAIEDLMQNDERIQHDIDQLRQLLY